MGANNGDYSGVDTYLRMVRQYPVISPAEERELLRQYAESKNPRIGNKLAKGNLRFVIKIALQYKNYGFPLSDLIQEGNLGMARAIDKYDSTKGGVRLNTYAVWWIRAYIHEYIIRNWSLVKMGTTQLQRRIFIHLISSKNGRGIGLPLAERYEVIAQNVGEDCSPQDAAEMLHRMLMDNTISMDETFHGDDTRSLHEVLEDENIHTEDAVVVAEDEIRRQEFVARLLSQLDKREEDIIRKRCLSDETLTLRELGDAMGVSKERVRQLEARGLKHLGNLIEQLADEGDEYAQQVLVDFRQKDLSISEKATVSKSVPVVGSVHEVRDVGVMAPLSEDKPAPPIETVAVSDPFSDELAGMIAKLESERARIVTQLENVEAELGRWQVVLS